MQQFKMSSVSTYILDLFITKECYAIIFDEKNFLHGECLQLLLSKIIGYAILVISSTMVKMPQIVKIVQNHSAEGVSLMSHLLQVFSGATSFTYGMTRNFPVSVWGENVAMSIQNLVICMLICVYCGRRTVLACVIGVLSVLCILTLCSPITPMYIHRFLALWHLPVVISSKVIQIRSNYMRQGTGQLSFLSVCMLNFRSFGRLFTFLVETDDWNKIAVYASASGCNVVLLGQMMYYSVLKRHKWKEF